MTPRTRITLFVAVVLATCAAQADVVWRLYAYSRGDASASHVVLIPFVSLAIIIRHRDEIFASVRTTKRAGVAVIAAAVAVSIGIRSFGPLPARTELPILVTALLTSWGGAFLLLFGWRAASAARFAFGFLAFTIPMPAELVGAVTALLKKGSAEAVAALFALTATPYHRDGYIFSLPNLAIEVADACSGIRSSIALLLTGLLAGHVFLRTAWKKGLLIAAIVPVVILKNGVRIVSLSLLANYVDPKFLVGRLHHDGGVVFFLLALGLLAPVLALLHRSEEQFPVREEPRSVLAPSEVAHH
jgi:exosortase